MTPTEQQVKTSARLQELGLCQNARDGVWFYIHPQKNQISSWDGELFYESIAKPIGPLPTAGECWPEINKILPAEWVVQISEEVISILDQNGKIFWKSLHWGDLDEAFRQALIALKEKEQ